jgi:hypothetical protein
VKLSRKSFTAQPTISNDDSITFLLFYIVFIQKLAMSPNNYYINVRTIQDRVEEDRLQGDRSNGGNSKNL